MTDVSVSFRWPCWCPSGWAPTWRLHRKRSIILGKQFLKMFRVWKIVLTWILARVFLYQPHFISQILEFIVLFLFLLAWQWKPAIIKGVSGVNLVWNHTCDFKIRWVHRKSSIWYHKHDFRPKFQDTKSNYNFITAILKISKLSDCQYLIDPVGGQMKVKSWCLKISFCVRNRNDAISFIFIWY